MQNSETLYGTDRVIADALLERKRQVVVEGFSRIGDDCHEAGRLALAAAAYAISWAGCKRIEREDGCEVIRAALDEAGPPDFWPMDPQWWKPHNDRHDLIRAIALLIAEVEHHDRGADTHPQLSSITALHDQLDHDGHRVERAGMVRSGCAVRATLQAERSEVAQQIPAVAPMSCSDSGIVSAPSVESSPADCPAESGSCGGGE